MCVSEFIVEDEAFLPNYQLQWETFLAQDESPRGEQAPGLPAGRTRQSTPPTEPVAAEAA